MGEAGRGWRLENIITYQKLNLSEEKTFAGMSFANRLE